MAAGPRLARPPSARVSSCQLITIPANTFKVLPCKPRSNLAERKWEYSESAGHFLYPSPEGGLVVVAHADRQETYECWSVEEGFRQLLANYCVRGEVRQESTTTAAAPAARTPPTPEATPRPAAAGAAATQGSIALPGRAPPRVDAKTYWNELIAVCALLASSLVVFSLFVAYRNRDRMKSMLKEGECASAPHKKPRAAAAAAGKPAENLPLNGAAAVPSASVSDHKGYQALNDNHICSTPPQEPSPDNGKGFSSAAASETRPLNMKESRVEMSPTGPRPRVRLGSEIKDSIV